MNKSQIAKVSAMLEDAVENIFSTLQDEMDIKYGDVDPWLYREINDKQNELAEKICYALMMQKYMNKAGDEE